MTQGQLTPYRQWLVLRFRWHNDIDRWHSNQFLLRLDQPRSQGLFLGLELSKGPRKRGRHSLEFWGPFLQRPGNLTGPESDLDIKVSRKVRRVLTSDEVHFVSFGDNFTVQFSNLLKIPLEWKTKQLNGLLNYRELRETGPRCGGGARALFSKSVW